MRAPSGDPLDLALRYLAVRPRSEAEVRRRLLRAGHQDAAVEMVLARLREQGLVDDAAFAQYWLEQRRVFRPRGERLLKAELRQRGIAHDLAVAATAAAAELEGASAEEDAYRAARKRALQLASAACEERTFKQRISQLLARRGFDWDTTAATVERLWSETRS